MSFTDQKITDEEIAAAGVQSQPNKLAGTAQQNKAVFDTLIKNLVKVRLNALIDELLGVSAAGQIGIDSIAGYTAATVQEALEEIVEVIQDISAGGVAPGTVGPDELQPDAVTEDKIEDGAVTEDKLDDLAVTTAKIALLAITTALLADGAVTAAKLGADILPQHVGIKIGNKTPTTADISEGQIYLKYS